MEAIKKVTKIDRAIVAKASTHQSIASLRRVAAYARVSTDSDEQFTSFEAQVDYYTRQITANADWALVEVYTDAYTPYGLTPKACLCFDHRVVGNNLSQICVSNFSRTTEKKLHLPCKKFYLCRSHAVAD